MNPVLDQIHRHRSIRKYLDRPVPESLLNNILSAGTMASSSGNMQAYSIIVTREEPLRKKMHEAHFHQSMLMDASVFLTFCADFHRMRRWLELSEAPENFDNLVSFLIASIDAILVSQNVALAAESEGLGICYMGTTLASCHKIAKILDCPKHVVPVVGFSLGYPDELPPERKRLPLKGIIHQEKYQHYSDETIQQIYSDREDQGFKRYMLDDRLRKMVEREGAENLAQIYTKVKYTRESHLRYSEDILQCLRDQGFISNGFESITL